MLAAAARDQAPQTSPRRDRRSFWPRILGCYCKSHSRSPNPAIVLVKSQVVTLCSRVHHQLLTMVEPQLSQRETRLAKAQVERIGFTPLHAPAKKESIIADVVLVHGLGGHPKDTWKYSANEKTSHQGRGFRKLFQRKRNTSSASAIEQQGSPSAECFWPEELLPRDFPNIRILTYGYDSNVSHFCKGAANQMTISQHGRTLLESLTDERRNCGHRPIIFVAHSLGGLLVKDAIIESRKYGPEATEQMAFQRCHAIMFFGTPHLGSGAANWGVLLSNIVEALGVGFSSYKGVLRQLAPDSEKLESLTREFNDILNASMPVEKIKIYSFQEGKGISAIKAFDGKVCISKFLLCHTMLSC